MYGSLKLERGVVSAVVPSNGYMDAAVVGDTGGFEIGLETARVTVGPDDSYSHAPVVLTVAIHPGRMRELGLLLLDKSGAPAFGEGMWRAIRESIDRDLITMRAPREQIDALVAASNRIKDAYP